VVVGGGILGVSLSYFISANTNANVSLIEQHNIASHTSTRNTGKVHAPFLYDPEKKQNFARAAFLGFKMWKEYCMIKSLPFKQDVVLEVATYDKAIDRLHKYVKWGYANGLQESEIEFLEEIDVARMEPNVRCLAAIYCSRDASVNYRLITQQLAEDTRKMGCEIRTGVKISSIEQKNGTIIMQTNDGGEIKADYVINAAGGNAVDIAHSMGVADEYTDLHFRGEYWQSPEEYHGLTKISVYSVPKHPEYPFLDPHWIVRADGRREIGPNAVPVFSPYAYHWKENIASFIPKVQEILGSGARKMWTDRQFLLLITLRVIILHYMTRIEFNKSLQT
jgi:L-2-hydroxyglutarate oxidase